MAWRIAHGTRISGRVGDDGRSGGLGLQLMNRVGVSVDADQTQRRQQLSVDVVPGLTVETSRALSWSGREDDDRIGVKWMLRY